MTEQDLIRELGKGLLKWIDFQANTRALVVGTQKGQEQLFVEVLEEYGVNTDILSVDTILHKEKKEIYDFIIISTELEKEKAKISGNGNPVEELLEVAKGLLKTDGRLFICVENRLGIRYFCGDKDPYTERNFDSIENYRRIGVNNTQTLQGKLYSKAEIVDLLEQSGFVYHKFYSVFPELIAPQILISEDYYPTEELNIRIFPQYHSPDTIFLEEEHLYTTLMENKLFHSMANGFFIECAYTKEGKENFESANQVTISMDRGKEDALCTIITEDNMVMKKPIYVEGEKKLKNLKENQIYLSQHEVPMVLGKIKDGSYQMPFVKGIPLVTYFRNLLRTDIDKFYKELDGFWELILRSSEKVSYSDIDWQTFNPYWDEEEKKKKKKVDRSKWHRIVMENDGREVFGPILKRGYVDFVLLNGLMTEQGMQFFDQESYIENFPARAIMLRNINFIYQGNLDLGKILSLEKLYDRYEIKGYREIYQLKANYFLTKLRNDEVLKAFHTSRRRNVEILNSNRQRMNYSTEEYLRLFVNIFYNIENKKLYLFGSGTFTKKFLAMYDSEYQITGILDNNKEKWGETLENIPIMSPDVLEGQDASTYKVIICIKNYVGVLKQVKSLGAKNIGIYDTNMEYPRKIKQVASVQSKSGIFKKYHTGYVAGVFDLFHIGHLNLLRRAKEQCEYLIVGVVTDEGVIQNKKTEPFIPFKERLEVVQACRYVDEAVGIPLQFCDTKDAYLKFQFDVQFSGSDYVNDPSWLAKKAFLQERGADLVFFPYTESTSSTKIKAMIEKKIL